MTSTLGKSDADVLQIILLSHNAHLVVMHIINNSKTSLIQSICKVWVASLISEISILFFHTWCDISEKAGFLEQSLSKENRPFSQ
jgi:hypothetical protein